MIRTLVLTCSVIGVAGCASQQSSEETLRQHGYSQSYVAGYHDGCPSGKRAGGDPIAQRQQDAATYAANADYKTGWDYGFVQCRDTEMQNEATASLIGSAIAGGMASTHGADGIDAREIMSGIDTSGLEALEQ